MPFIFNVPENEEQTSNVESEGKRSDKYTIYTINGIENAGALECVFSLNSMNEI